MCCRSIQVRSQPGPCRSGWRCRGFASRSKRAGRRCRNVGRTFLARAQAGAFPLGPGPQCACHSLPIMPKRRHALCPGRHILQTSGFRHLGSWSARRRLCMITRPSVRGEQTHRSILHDMPRKNPLPAMLRPHYPPADHQPCGGACRGKFPRNSALSLYRRRKRSASSPTTCECY